MTELTKRERVMRTLRFEETDRVPLYDIFQNDAVSEFYAGRPLDYDTGTETVAMAVGRALDMTRMVGGPARPGQHRSPDGMVYQIERYTSWITERPWKSSDAIAEWVKGEILRLDGIVWDHTHREQIHALVEERWAGFAKNDPTGRQDPAMFVMESGVGLTEMYHVLGMEDFVMFSIMEPDLTEEWIEARNQCELRRVAVIGDPHHLPVVLPYDDIAHKTGTLFSPDWLRQLWVPRLKKLVKAWHDQGACCIFHSDGRLWDVVDDLVDAGVDGLNPLEVLAGMTPKAVRERYPRLVLTGGIDVSQLLPNGSPEEVRAACREAIRDTGGRGYFMGSSTELHWSVPLENARAMYETPALVAAEAGAAQ